jgi:uncharacterized repeat protein (TIGR01451 family)
MIITQKFYKFGGLVILTSLLVLVGSLWQSDVLKVQASVQVLVVSRTAIAFSTVFPGEDLSETYSVALDTSSNLATYVTTLQSPSSVGPGDPLHGLKDLCPLLDIKSIDNPSEGDTLTSASLSRPHDILDKWQVRLKVPAIKGEVSQDHDGGIIVMGGDFGCKIIITTNKVKQPEITLNKTGTADNHGKISYKISYNITGSGMLTNVVITDPLPAGTTFVSADHGGTLASTIVTWHLGSLTAPTSGNVNLVVSTFSQACTFENNAKITADNLDKPVTASSHVELHGCKQIDKKYPDKGNH